MAQLPSNPFADFRANTTQWNPANARALVYASQLAYGKDPEAIKDQAAPWGFDTNHVYVVDPGNSVLQAVILGGKDYVVLAFRGTRPDQLSDWMDDADIKQAAFNSLFGGPDVGQVHSGFGRLLAGDWAEIYQAVGGFQKDGQTLWITGHSLGGALAVMATAAFTFSKVEPVNGLYTFGQPRVGDPNFYTQSESHFGDVMFRFVNNQDIVTRVPPRLVPFVPPLFYKHSGQLRFFDAQGNLHSDDHWWNSFLLKVDVGFDKMNESLRNPIADHFLQNYINLIEKYLAAGAPPPV
jgi:triacylglycerol lipase